jgi:uncharacterized protein YndB with AHSA1/START domain
MSKGLVAATSITIHAPRREVWQALVSPDAIKQYMFGADVQTTWREDSSIVWKGEWQGRSYEDTGTIVRHEPESRLEYTHFSPLTGLPDRPEHYHTVTIELSVEGDSTRISLAQDNNATEEARKHSEQNWTVMLQRLKEYAER